MAKFLFEGVIKPLEKASALGCVPILLGGVFVITAIALAGRNSYDWLRHNYIQNKICSSLNERGGSGEYVYIEECETLVVNTPTLQPMRAAFAVRYTFDTVYSWHKPIGWQARRSAVVPVVLDGEYEARKKGFSGEYYVWVDSAVKVHAYAPHSEGAEPELIHIATITPQNGGASYRMEPTVEGMEHVRMDQQWFAVHFANK